MNSLCERFAPLMAETLHWLGNETGLQVIILTCHHREAAALDEMGMDYHYAEL